MKAFARALTEMQKAENVKNKKFKKQKGHRRLTVFRLDALTGSLLTQW
jgi:hypothetical protein